MCEQQGVNQINKVKDQMLISLDQADKRMNIEHSIKYQHNKFLRNIFALF